MRENLALQKISDFSPGISGWARDEKGFGATEFALIFPILMILVLAVWEVGTAISINQKAIGATQIVADLVARESTVTDDMLAEAVQAGRLVLQPYDTDLYGVDIVSVRFAANGDPELVWRETVDMAESGTLIERTRGLGNEGEGALAVIVTYEYTPILGGRVLNPITFAEVAFSRGRKSAVVCREGVDC